MELKAFLERQAAPYADTQALGRCLGELVAAGLDLLPLPGSGQTLQRLQQLADVAGHDLGLCKLYEGHTDALAIIQQLGGYTPSGSTWGMWAAEPPSARVKVIVDGEQVRLTGRKAWCSGASALSHGLLTAWDEHDRQQLVAVALDHPGVTLDPQSWHAVGMGATGSIDIVFNQVPARRIGRPGDYLRRPGFWQGGIGIAACWYGAAQSLAQRLRSHCLNHPEPHALAHLGAVDRALYGAASVLRNSAAAIDAAPLDDAQLLARRARAVVEHAAEEVILHVGHALGAGPYCNDGQFAQLVADLPVFLRQSHAERDLAALGQTVVTRTWAL